MQKINGLMESYTISILLNFYDIKSACFRIRPCQVCIWNKPDMQFHLLRAYPAHQTKMPQIAASFALRPRRDYSHPTGNRAMLLVIPPACLPKCSAGRLSCGGYAKKNGQRIACVCPFCEPEGTEFKPFYC